MLPIVAEQLPGATRVLDVGCGEGQVARHVERIRRQRRGRRRRSVREPARGRARARAAVRSTCAGYADALPVRDARVRRGRGLPRVRAHHRGGRRARRGRPRCWRPAGVFLFLLNHPLLQVPGSGWIDDQILEEQYWRIGPYLVEDVSLEEIAPGVMLPFVHRPLSRYVNRLRRGRPAHRAHGGAGTAARASSPGRLSTPTRSRSPGCWCYGR